MRVLAERQLAATLGALTGAPRVVVGGNFSTPWRALAMLDGTLAEYRLFALNAQAEMPDREGVTLESPFVGPGMRGRSRLRYFPCRLSLVPALLTGALPPDVVLVQTSVPSGGTVTRCCPLMSSTTRSRRRRRCRPRIHTPRRRSPPRSLTGWPRSSATARRCRPASARCPTLCWPGCTAGAGWPCGQRCSVTECSGSTRRARLTRASR